MTANNAQGPADVRPGPVVETLSTADCWRLLAAERFGRMAMTVSGDLDIFPVNFVADEERQDLVIRTAEGTKLVEVVIAGAVALEADARDVDSGVAWSVVAKGTAEVLDRFDDIYRAEGMGIEPWVDTPKERFVRIHVTALSGRRFHRLPQTR